MSEKNMLNLDELREALQVPLFMLSVTEVARPVNCYLSSSFVFIEYYIVNVSLFATFCANTVLHLISTLT